jgi:hypothetical protein
VSDPDPELARRIAALSDEELSNMVFVEHERYREEAIEFARAEVERRNLSVPASAPPSALPTPSETPNPMARIDSRRLAPLWPGFAIAATFLVLEIALAIGNSWVDQPRFILLLVALLGGMYWLYCIHRLHAALGEATAGRYSVTPQKAVLFHFIPLLNLLWIFEWPWRLAKHLRSQPGGSSMSRIVASLAIPIGLLVGRWFDTSIGLAILFGTLAYMHLKVRKAGVEPGGVEAASAGWNSRAQS